MAKRVEVDDKGAVVLDQDFGDIFDDILEDLHDNPSVHDYSQDGPTLKEQYEQKKLAIEFCQAVMVHGSMRLLPSGITIYKCEEEEEGFHAYARDLDGRTFEAMFKYTDFNYGPNTDVYRDALTMICDSFFLAHRAYIERMQQAEADIAS